MAVFRLHCTYIIALHQGGRCVHAQHEARVAMHLSILTFKQGALGPALGYVFDRARALRRKHRTAVTRTF